MTSRTAFGQLIDPVTGQIGATPANDAVPDAVSDADADYAWVGGARKLYEHQGSIASIEMAFTRRASRWGLLKVLVTPYLWGKQLALTYSVSVSVQRAQGTSTLECIDDHRQRLWSGSRERIGSGWGRTGSCRAAKNLDMEIH
jgi:hypothetical protein